MLLCQSMPHEYEQLQEKILFLYLEAQKFMSDTDDIMYILHTGSYIDVAHILSS
jgi:hypothetical protein